MGDPENSAKSINPVNTRGALFSKSFVDFWRRFSKNRAAVVGLVIVAIFGFLAIFASTIMPYDRQAQTLNAPQNSPHGCYKPPSNSHWFGTDGLGRDVFSRFIWGSRISLLVGFLAASVSVSMGVVLGATAGYLGGRIDGVIMCITDVFLSLSTFFLILLIVAIWGRTLSLVKENSYIKRIYVSK